MATSAKTTSKGAPDSIGQFKDDGALSYSDFMRSLAAKYNDSSTESASHHRTTTLFDIKPKMIHGSILPFSNLLSSQPSSESSEIPSLFPNNTNSFPILAGLAAVSGQSNLFGRPNVQSHLLQTFMSSKAVKRPASESINKVAKYAKKSSNYRACQTPLIPCSDESKVIQNWSVKEVCEFVESIEICRPFVHAFREQSIDGLALLLLTEDHLLHQLSMTLGPVLKFKAVLSSRIGSCPACLHCMHCHTEFGEVSESAEDVRSTVKGTSEESVS